jgi:hypothetical protein
VSAVGVWGTPLEVASRAADIATALPTAQMLRERCTSGYLARVHIHSKMVQLIQHAGSSLANKHAVSPYMSRERLLGRWGLCDRKV